VRPPGSKSITNRALVCAALAAGTSHLSGVLHSEDTAVMIDCLKCLGIGVQPGFQGDSLTVEGCGGLIPHEGAKLYVGNSGTTIRFLTAMVALGHGRYELDGVHRMRERPIADLLEALNQLGADARDMLHTGCPPVLVVARGLSGGSALVRGDISSQFLSGLLLSAPYAQRDVEVQVEGPLVSQPYVEMTIALMRQFGSEVTVDRQRSRYHVRAPLPYQARRFAIEPDASAASYFWAAAAITGGEVTVQGLGRSAMQGDVAFCDCLAQMGCSVDYHDAPGGSASYSDVHEPRITVRGGPLRGIDVDMNAISDTVQTLAAVALFADGPTRLRGVAHIRHKESDRIGDLARELRKLGATVEEQPDGLTIVPALLRGATIETYQDHRMAMSLALVGLRVPGVVIRDPDCTAKTYPRFFDDLRQITASSDTPGG
jgi:3-phosphoshikimate 1-carboxyvinyltransferase